MADIELVIKISEEIAKQFDYEYYVDGEISKYITDTILEAYCNGTPLPKGHGRLFDERDIVNGNYEIIGNKIYEIEPIVEAESEGTDADSN